LFGFPDERPVDDAGKGTLAAREQGVTKGGRRYTRRSARLQSGELERTTILDFNM